ncbi:transmembrane protein 209-like [Apus apus]|uniref:transmembrane protein 209-like n=1 Tax=Apus apus TaxID=8895 RepID=UPI0021F835B6|nr:transmembrane protein 209-like [Apus apus]
MAPLCPRLPEPPGPRGAQAQGWLRTSAVPAPPPSSPPAQRGPRAARLTRPIPPNRPNGRGASAPAAPGAFLWRGKERPALPALPRRGTACPLPSPGPQPCGRYRGPPGSSGLRWGQLSEGGCLEAGRGQMSGLCCGTGVRAVRAVGLLVCNGESVTPGQSPATSLMDRTIKMRQEAEARRVALAWGLLHMSMAGMIYTAMSGRLISCHCNIPYGPLSCIGLALASVFSVNALLDFWRYCKYTGTPRSWAPSPGQQPLLGWQSAAPPTVLAAKTVPSATPSAPIQGQTVLSYSPSRSPRASPRFPPAYLTGYRPQLQAASSSSPSFGRAVTRSPSSSYKVYGFSPSSSGSLYASSIGRVQRIRLKPCHHASPFLYHAPTAKEDYMTDLKSLQTFLQNEEKKQRRVQLGSSDSSSPSSSPTSGNHRCFTADSALVLLNYEYQLACLPRAPPAHRDRAGLSSKQAAEEHHEDLCAARAATSAERAAAELLENTSVLCVSVTEERPEPINTSAGGRGPSEAATCRKGRPSSHDGQSPGFSLDPALVCWPACSWGCAGTDIGQLVSMAASARTNTSWM